MLPNTLYTVTDAAEFLAYNPEHVRRLVRQGKLKSEGRIGRSIIFTRETLRAWRAARLTSRLPGTPGDRRRKR